MLLDSGWCLCCCRVWAHAVMDARCLLLMVVLGQGLLGLAHLLLRSPQGHNGHNAQPNAPGEMHAGSLLMLLPFAVEVREWLFSIGTRSASEHVQYRNTWMTLRSPVARMALGVSGGFINLAILTKVDSIAPADRTLTET